MIRHEAFAVEGLTWGTCVAEVLERIRDVDGVVAAGVRLVVGGESPVVVTCESGVARGVVAGAVTRAGFAVRTRRPGTHPSDELVITRRGRRTVTDPMLVGGEWR